MKRRTQRPNRRRGTMVVELAVVAPVFVVIALGVMEASRLYEVQNQMSTAVREGARLAAMDRDGIVEEGSSTNDKVETDIRNILLASGLPGDQVNVSIHEPGQPNAEFDLDDPVNDLRMFEINVELSYDAINPFSVGEGLGLTATIVFRNARAALVQ